jgi:hypothetical protein
MIEQDGYSFNIKCDNCGKLFFSFDLSELYCRGHGKTYKEYIQSAMNKGHIVGDDSVEGYEGEKALDFCTKRCQKEFHDKYSETGAFFDDFAEDTEEEYPDPISNDEDTL